MTSDLVLRAGADPNAYTGWPWEGACAMDESRATRLIEWIKGKSKNDGCSWCGGHDFEVRNELRFQDDQGSQLASLAAIECTGCNQTFLFDTRVL